MIIIKNNYFKKYKIIKNDLKYINKNYYNFAYLIKYFIFIIINFFIIFFKHFFIRINKKIKIEIDNILDSYVYENNMNFSNYSTDIKAIALYYPTFSYINNYLFKFNNRCKNYTNYSNTNLIKNKINLAKNHGIYGFGIFYNPYDKLNIKVLDIFLENKSINFQFLLVWKNNIYNNISKINILSKRKQIENELDKFIKDIRKYFVSQKYIKINGKPILSVNNPLIIQNIKDFILILRLKAKENEIGEIFILCPLNKGLNKSNYINLFDAAYDFLTINFDSESINYNHNLYYLGVIYKNILLNQLKINFTLYRNSFIEINSNSNNKNKLKGYLPEKYYILNKIIIKWIKLNFHKNNRLLFISSWNNYQKGNYLEPDEKYGYASLNCFSKALFNLPYKIINYNLLDLDNKCEIAIQVHIYYEDLTGEIINKTNNIPVKFDLFLTTTSYFKKMKIEELIKKYSKANRYKIEIVENKGRDVLPLIHQMKYQIKKYKYLCHIHTKKSKHDIILGYFWRNYLYENLLGSKEIISEILNDFNEFEKLGFIFPELYFNMVKNIDNFYYTEFYLNKQNIKYTNYVLNKIFPGFKIGDKLIFPVGNMFWAKVNAIHQIFEKRFEKLFPKELDQSNGTIMHAIERIWLYLVKLNGYYYKIIFKHY